MSRSLCSLRAFCTASRRYRRSLIHEAVLLATIGSARCAMKASTSAASQTVTDSPSLNGLGNRPSRTQRQMVAGLTGNLPGFAGVLANSLMRITLCDTWYPSEMRHGAEGSTIRYFLLCGNEVCSQNLRCAGRLQFSPFPDPLVRRVCLDRQNSLKSYLCGCALHRPALRHILVAPFEYLRLHFSIF